MAYLNNVKLPTTLRKGFCWSEFDHIIPRGVPLSDVTSGAFWKAASNTLKPFDVINAVAEDGAFDVQIRLIGKTADTMEFSILRETIRDDAVKIRRESFEGRYQVQPSRQNADRFAPTMFNVRNVATGRDEASGLSKEDAEAHRARLIKVLEDAA